MDQEKVKIKINIAGESITLTVPYSAQDDTRATEKNVNSLFATWRKRFPEKSDKELLAMIAFQYASYYDGLIKEYDAALDYTQNMAQDLSEIIRDHSPAPIS